MPASGNAGARTAEPAAEVAATTSHAELWSVVREHPERAPAALALAAVNRYAQPSRAQAAWLRETYPDVDPDRVALVAISMATRRTRLAALATALPLGGLAGLSARLWTNARLVLEIAAIYGFDPTDPARAAEMLALLDVYPDARAAQAAVRALNNDADEEDGRRAPALPRFGAATAAFARQTVARLVPGSGLLLASLAGAAEVSDLAARAVRFYRAHAGTASDRDRTDQAPATTSASRAAIRSGRDGSA